MTNDEKSLLNTLSDEIETCKAAEESSKRYATRLALALEAGKVSTWDLDIVQKKVSLDGPVYDTLAVPPNSDFSTWSPLVHPEDLNTMAEKFERLIKGIDSIIEYEYRLPTKTGDWHWLYSRGAVSVRDEQGQGKFAHGVVFDIHQRKMNEESVKKRSRELEAASQDASLHLWHYHIPEGRIDDLGTLTESLSYTRSARTSRADFWLSIVHPQDIKNLKFRPLLPLPEKLVKCGVELRLRTKDGQWRWMVVRARVTETDSSGAETLIAGTCLDITDQKNAGESLLHAAQHDSLTGLPSRALTYAFGDRLLAAAPRRATFCAVLFVDLDRFKPINDTYGHAAGDEVLRKVARRLRRCVRGEDVVGRLGGDEFMVVLAQLEDIDSITHVANHCLQAISQPLFFNNIKLQVSASIGISVYPNDGSNMGTLIRNADVAMYHAKKLKHNSFKFYTPAMNQRVESVLRLESRLHDAVENHEFCLNYQPVVDTNTQRIVSAEALLRWPAENIGPEEFIPLAESNRLILPLSDWILREACRQQKVWSDKGMEQLRISINISPLQFRQPNFANQIARAVTDSGIDPTLLQLEITEMALVHDFNAVVDTLHTLRRAGHRIALDDFGKGYFALQSLKSLPLDAIKVDKAFVVDLTHDKVDLAISETIINMGTLLDLEVIAEGIENEEIMELLRAKHCGHMQGFYFSGPLPPCEFEKIYKLPFEPQGVSQGYV